MNVNQSGWISPKSSLQTLARIRRTLGIGSFQMAKFLELTPGEYEKMITHGKEPPVRSILRFCEALHISFEQFVTETFCYKTMSRHYCGDIASIPEKYTIAGKSKRRVLSNLLDFVENQSNAHKRFELLRYLQINDSALANSEDTVNLRCTVDAIEWMERETRDDAYIKTLGKELILASKNSEALEDLKSCRTVYELFDALFSKSGIFYRHFETNFLWDIEKVVPGQKIIVRGRLNEEVRELVGDETIKSRAGSTVRNGILSAIPKVIGWEEIPVAINDFFVSRENSYSMELDISGLVRSHPRASLALAPTQEATL